MDVEERCIMKRVTLILFTKVIKKMKPRKSLFMWQLEGIGYLFKSKEFQSEYQNLRHLI